MIFSILKDIFCAINQAEEDNLNKFWFAVFDRHELFITDNDDINTLTSSHWYSTLSEINKKIINDSVTKSIQSEKKPIAVKITKHTNGYSILEAHRFLSQPLIILLENSLNDAYFFNALLKCFKNESKKINEHINEGWAEYGMGGGTTINNVLQSKMKAFNSQVLTKQKHHYLRFFVLIDSDKKFKNDELKHEAKKLISFLDEINVSYHILEKREMENYLPNEAFTKIKDNQAYIQAYLNLSAEQKDFFDLEKGFANKNFSQLPQEVQHLYRNISKEDKKIFRKNNLKNINSKRGNFKSDFPKLFESSIITKTLLLARTKHQDDPDELKNILKKVTKLL